MEVLSQKSIKETISKTFIGYIFENEDDFYDIGYKVLQNEEKYGFVKCVKIQYNGKMKLVYDISPYKPLSNFLSQADPNTFISTIEKMLKVLGEARENGFMQLVNINLSFSKAFIDENTLEVYLVYLPQKTNSTQQDEIHAIQKLKNEMTECMHRNKLLQVPEIITFLAELDKGVVTFEKIENSVQYALAMQKGHTSDKSMITDSNFTQSSAPLYGEIHQSDEMLKKKQNIQNEISKKSAFKLLSHKKSFFIKVVFIMIFFLLIGVAIVTCFMIRERNIRLLLLIICGFAIFVDLLFMGILIFIKKRNEKPTMLKSPISPASEGGATEILDDLFTPTIVLLGYNTPEKIEMVVTKPEFVIGKNPEQTDGCLDFNHAISRVHCKISCIDGKNYICDLGSSNGTFVNSDKLPQKKSVEIRYGDRLTLANSEFVVKPYQC